VVARASTDAPPPSPPLLFSSVPLIPVNIVVILIKLVFG